MAKDKIEGKRNYLICLVEKAKRKLHYERTNEHADFNEACQDESDAEKELEDAQKELNDFETEQLK